MSGTGTEVVPSLPKCQLRVYNTTVRINSVVTLSIDKRSARLCGGVSIRFWSMAAHRRRNLLDYFCLRCVGIFCCWKHLVSNTKFAECLQYGLDCLSRMMCLRFTYILFFFNLTYSRWASTLRSCLWSLRIFPSLPDSHLLTTFYRDASSALLQLVNQWLNFPYSSSTRAFRYRRQNKISALTRIELTTSALAGVQVTY